MRSLLRGWRSRHLVTAWCTYWVALVAVALGPAIPAAWRVSRAADGHGSMAASLDNGLLDITITSHATTVWAGAVDPGAAVLWIVGPPLLLWLAWLLTRPRAPVAPSLERGTPAPALDAPRWEPPPSPARERAPEARRDH